MKKEKEGISTQFGSLGKRVERVGVILGKTKEEEFLGRVLPASSVFFPGRLN